MWHVLDDREAITFLRGSGNPKHHEEADELEVYICKPWRYERIDEGQTRLYLFIGLLTGLLNGLVPGLLNGLNVDDEPSANDNERSHENSASLSDTRARFERLYESSTSSRVDTSFTERNNKYRSRPQLHHSAAGGHLECVQLLCEK